MGAYRIWIPLLVVLALSITLFHSTSGYTRDERIIEPEDPVEDESITIRFLVLNETPYPVFGARLSSGEKNFTADPSLIETINESANVILFACHLRFEEPGQKELIEEYYDGQDWYEAGSFNITVKKKEAGGGNFLDLPDWYCSVGVILLTLGALFLTWSYFKGRRMQKKPDMEDNEMFKCSDCGRPLKGNEDACPWCGVEITGEEYICGKCKKGVGPDDSRCPHCGASLITDSGGGSSGKKSTANRSSKKNRTRTTDIPQESKKKCRNCGTVLLKSESKCPVCGKEDRDPERSS